MQRMNPIYGDKLDYRVKQFRTKNNEINQKM